MSDWIKNFDVVDELGKKFDTYDTAKSNYGQRFHKGFLRSVQRIYAFTKE